jgi:NAD(P)-dependent dehydrogenase (short-subunit alcohol dehydrogenase family)
MFASGSKEMKMDLQLADRRALVTGSTSGIGTEIARTLALEGVKVVVHGRDRGRAQAVIADIEAMGGQAAAALGDLATQDGVQAVIEAAAQAFGGIDILINNAGGSNSTSAPGWFETPIEDWEDSYRQNTLPAVRLAQAFVPEMRERRWGRVIQISSRNAISAYAQFGPYGAAKAALNNLTLSLSKALAGTGVTSNGIMPGLIYTPLVDPWLKYLAKQLGSDDPQVGKDFALKNVLRQTVSRVGQPKDVAAAVCFLASPLSDFMTGTTFRIDGGATPTV